MFRAILVFSLPMLGLAGCGSSNGAPKFRSYDLNVFHPSPYSTFVGVSPGARGDKLPRIEELGSRDFNTYLRDLIGCTVKSDAELYKIGNERDPSGYLVPIACMN